MKRHIAKAERSHIAAIRRVMQAHQAEALADAPAPQPLWRHLLARRDARRRAYAAEIALVRARSLRA